MCDLLGLSFNQPINARITLDVFQRQSQENPDGWGVAYYQNELLHIVKEPLPATSSQLFDFIENSTRSSTYLCHVRRTTMGIRSYLNTHPFYRKIRIGDIRQEWAFAHNGTLETIEKLKLRRYTPLGETDSEHAFCYILDWIEDNNIHTWNSKLISAFNKLLCEINDEVNTFNCLISDGVHLFCYSDENKHNGGLRFVQKELPFKKTDLITKEEHLGSIEIYDANKDKSIQTSGYIVVTEELKNESWIEIESGKLVVVKDGIMIY